MHTRNLHLASPARRGAAVYIALFILIPIAALTFALVQTGVRFSHEHTRSGEDDRALMIAEAGLADGYRYFSSDQSGVIGTAANPAYFGDGVFWTEVDQVGSALFLIKSSAMYESGRASVEQLVFRFSNSLFNAAVFSSGDLVIDSQTLIDSFDSTVGPYAGQVVGGYVSESAIVESNGDITVSSSVEVHGDVYPGPDESVTVASSGDVSGSQQPLGEPIDLPTVTAPPIPSTGPLTVNTSAMVLPPGAYNFSSLTVNTGKKLTVTGPTTLVIGDWDILSNAEMTFDNTLGPIEVYVTGDVDLSSNSMIITTSKTAVDLQLFLIGGPSQVADLRSNSDFYGAIYSEEGTVRVRSNFEVFGAVMAEQVIIDSNAKIHYDEALAGLGTGFNYIPAVWTRGAFEDQGALANRRDPFKYLGVDPTALPMPEDAEL